VTLTCALCGRSMSRAAFTIGALAVGPVCGKRAGLLTFAREKASLVCVGRFKAARRSQDDSQLVLVLEVAA
jgi:hypothetical protein